MRSVFLFILLSLALLLTPNTATSQPLSEADTIRFQLPESSQFLPGRAGTPEALKSQLAKVEIERRDFDQLWVVGTYDEMGWEKSACNLEGNIPLQQSWEIHQDQCDAVVAGWRSVVTAQYIIDKGWTSAWKVRERRLLDERERSVLLIFVDKKELFALENKFEKISTSVRKLKRQMQEAEKAIAENRKQIETNDQQLADHERRLDKLEKKVRSGPKFSAFLGVGAERFAGVNTPGIEAGFQLGNIELAGWYGYRKNVGTVKLPKPDGLTDYGRSSYGATLSWYPLSYKRVEFGPSVGFEHGEDFLSGREKFITVYETWQAGLSTRLKLTSWLDVGARLHYAPIRNANVPNLEFERLVPQWSGCITLRVNLWR